MTTYWKAVRPDGTDFRTGLVQWAPPNGHVGEWVVHHPTASEIGNHPSRYLSVSTEPTDCTGMEWPCRLLEVEAVGEVTSPDQNLPHKRAGVAFRVIREVPATDALGPQGEYVASLISNIRGVTSDDAERLAAAWDAARDATRDAALNATRDAARYAVWAAALDATWDATWALLVRDLITTEQYDALTRPWRTAVGSIHPDDPAL